MLVNTKSNSLFWCSSLWTSPGIVYGANSTKSTPIAFFCSSRSAATYCPVRAPKQTQFVA